jgi:AraC-like DNA-binding protein
MALPADGDYNRVPYRTNVPIMFYENTQDENYPLHWHTATEIIMPLEHEYNVFLLKRSYMLRENDILIIPSCELHSITVPPSARTGKRIILMFEPTLLYSLAGLSGAMSLLYNMNLLTVENTPEIYGIARSLLLAAYDEFLRADDLRNPAIYAKIIDLYITMIRYYRDNKTLSLNARPRRRQQYITRLNAVFEYIDKHISEELTLESAAGIAHFSKYHFEHVFKEYTNSSFYQYLKRARIKKAETLLLNPELAITEVAQESGFESLTTFNRVFKEIKNCTPSEYKKLVHLG